MSPLISVPTPPAFLDPLTLIESCFYYAVPKFFGQNHPNTRWMVAMIKNTEEDRLKHKLEISPGAFKGVYYQMMDCPQLYTPEDVASMPMFKKRTVTYLTPLGIALYLGNTAVVEMLLAFRDPYGELVCDPNEPQYATHLQDNDVGDFHAFPPFLVMMRRSSFSCSQTMIKAGWDPSKPVAMPMRRKFERRVLYLRDWLEVALSILCTRPMWSLQCLLRELTKGTVYQKVQFPLEKLHPSNPAEAEPFGLINVEELPPGVEMIGVRSLLDMAEHYDRYLQMRTCALQVNALKREAAAVGLNPEVLMIQAQDFDGGLVKDAEQTEASNSVGYSRLRRGENNSSAVEDGPPPPPPRHIRLNVNMSAAKPKADLDPQYASEGCRILHYALIRDTRGKSMQVCMEAFCVLLQRGFYQLPAKPQPTTSLARDVYNTASILLNLVQREQGKVDKIVEKIKSGVKKFAHLEEHKQLENRKTACIQYMNKLVGVLAKLLLHSKILVDFIQSEFPPFNPANSNFPLNPLLAQKFQEIKFGVMREFNTCKEAWVFLDKDMLKRVNEIAEMQLHFKVGKTPTELPKAAGKKGGDKNKSNMSNTNSCFVSYTRVQRRPRRAALSTAAAASADAAAVSPVTTTSSALADAGGPFLYSSDDDLTDDLLDLRGLAATANCFGEATLTAERREEGDSSAKTGTEVAPDMEELLASLCREVDSLFRPLESGDVWTEDEKAPTGTMATWAPAATSTAGGSRGQETSEEHSTIEPELAPTPMPSPEVSPAPAAAAAGRQVAVGDKRKRHRAPQPSEAAKSQSKQGGRGGVRRLLSRLSAKETTGSATSGVGNKEN